MKIKVILLVIVLILTATLDCDEIIKSKPERNGIWSLGVGLGYQFYAASLTDSIFSGFRGFVYPNMYDAYNTNNELYAVELSYLYGKPFYFDTRHKTFLSYSTGISYLYYPYLDDRNKHHTIGIPIDINMVKGLTDHIGYGVNFTYNYNLSTKMMNLFFSLYLGDFRNKDYDHSRDRYKVSRILELYYPKMKKGEMGEVTGRAILLNFNMLDNYLKGLFTEDYKRGSYCGTTGIRLQNYGILLPFNYIDCRRNSINGHYDKLIFGGLKTRYYVPDSGGYFDLGFMHYSAHKRESIFDEEGWNNNYCLSAGYGFQVYINKYITICNQINIDIPISGDDNIYYNHVFYTDKSWALYYELIVPGLEFKF